MSHIPGTGHPTATRSLTKTIVWRVIATTDTFILTLLASTFWADKLGLESTDAYALAGTVAGLEVVTKMILYYFHERAWSKVDWGLEDIPIDTTA